MCQSIVNLTGHLLPAHMDHSRWSFTLHVKPHELGCKMKSNSPRFAIIHGTTSAYLSTGIKMTKLGATNGAVFLIPHAPVSSTLNTQRVFWLNILSSSHSDTSKYSTNL